MISLADSQPLKTNLFSSTTGVLQKDISVTKSTAALLAQLVERRSAVREVEGSSPRPDQHSGS